MGHDWSRSGWAGGWPDSRAQLSWVTGSLPQWAEDRAMPVMDLMAPGELLLLAFTCG